MIASVFLEQQIYEKQSKAPMQKKRPEERF